MTRSTSTHLSTGRAVLERHRNRREQRTVHTLLPLEMTGLTLPGTTPGQAGRHPSTALPLSQSMLAALPFSEFAHLVANLLTHMGYEDVRVTGRAAGRGRNGTGGYDLECFVSDGQKRRRIIVLLKQFGTRAWVFQRMVDELRGVAVREGADEALLITTGKLSPVIAQCEGVAGVDPGLRTLPPVERIGGDRLSWLLAAYGVNRFKTPRTLQSSDSLDRLDSRDIPVSAEKAGSSLVPPAKRRVRSLQPGGEPMPKPCGIVLEVRVALSR